MSHRSSGIVETRSALLHMFSQKISEPLFLPLFWLYVGYRAAMLTIDVTESVIWRVEACNAACKIISTLRLQMKLGQEIISFNARFGVSFSRLAQGKVKFLSTGPSQDFTRLSPVLSLRLVLTRLDCTLSRLTIYDIIAHLKMSLHMPNMPTH